LSYIRLAEMNSAASVGNPLAKPQGQRAEHPLPVDSCAGLMTAVVNNYINRFSFLRKRRQKLRSAWPPMNTFTPQFSYAFQDGSISMP